MEQITEQLCRYKGYNFPTGTVTPEYIDSLQGFEIRDSDIFLVTYPKSGRIGDWKNTFTVAQSERVDRILEDRLSDMNLEFIWE